MEFHLPKMQTGYAYNPFQSLYPNLWENIQGYWSPAMGKTGNYLPDWSGIQNISGSGATLNAQLISQGATVNVASLQASATVNVTSISNGTQGKVNVLGITPGTQAQLNITGISAGTTATINITAVVTTVATYTATVSGGVITALTATNAGGAGYTTGQYLTVFETGSGNNAVVQVNTIGGGGAIATFTIITGGTGYTNAAGGCSVGLSGSITAASIVTQGTGYVVGQVVPVAGAGSNATITVLTVGTTNILTFAINNPGTGYSVATPVNLTPSGSITTVSGTIPVPGTNYVVNQQVPFLPYYGTGATFNITASAGVVQATPIIVAAGTGYAIGQVINIVQNGASGATLTVTSTIASTGAITSVSLLSGGSGYVTATPLGVTPAVNGTSFVTVNTLSGSGIATFTTTTNSSQGYMINSTVPMAASGPITAVSINTAGTQYVAGQTLGITQGPSVNANVAVSTIGGTAATFNITGVNAFGQITSITLGAGGTNYSVNQIVALNLAGSNNSAYITVNTISGGAIVTFTLTYAGNLGAKYTVATATGIQAGNITALGAITGTNTGYIVSTNAINIATLPFSGPVTAATFATGGQGYYAGQVINIIQGTSNNATVTATTVGAAGAISAISFTSGAGYYLVTNGLSCTSGGVAATLSVGAGGTGYVAGQVLQLSGSSGTFGPGTFSVSTVSAGGVITAISLLTGGSGYGSGATFTITTSGGVVQATPTIANGGANYSIGQVLSIIQSTGVGATVTVTATNGAAGAITAISLTTGGTGYTNAAGLSSGFIATSGILNGMGVANPGSGYSIWQELSIVEPGGSYGTAIVTGINSTGGITSVSLQNGGQGYSTALANVTSIASGATIDIKMVTTSTSMLQTTAVTGSGGLSSVVIWNSAAGYRVGQFLNVIQAGASGGVLQVASVSGTPATFSITATAGAITAVPAIVSGGTGYANGQVLRVIQAGAYGGYLTVTSTSSGVITGISILSGGTGYVTANPVPIDGPGNIATVTVFAAGQGYSTGFGAGTVTAGAIYSAVINAAGTGYTVGQIVPINQAAGAGGSVIVRAVGGGGNITAIDIYSQGFGYTVATGVALATGVVTGISLASGGTTYTTGDVVQLYPSTTAYGATFNVYASGGVIQWAVVNNGGIGYSVGNLLNIQAGDYTATIHVQAVSSGVITQAFVVNPGTTGYTTANGVTTSTGANVKILVASGGVASSLNLLTGGQTFVVLNSMSLSSNTGFTTVGLLKNLGVFGNPVGAGATLSLTTSGGSISSAGVNAAGTGYLVNQYLNIAGGTGAFGTVSSINVTGGITGFNLLYGGTGYSNGTQAVQNVAATWSASPARGGYSLSFSPVPIVGWPGVTIGKTNANFPSSTNGLSVGIWFNSTDTVNTIPMMFIGPPNAVNSPGMFYITFNPSANSGNGQFAIGGAFYTAAEWDWNANNINTLLTTQTICNGQWHFLVLTCDATSQTTNLYLDAQLIGSTTGTFFYNQGNGQPISIGATGSNNPGAAWNCGDIGIWNRVLNIYEINQMYFGATPLQPFTFKDVNWSMIPCGQIYGGVGQSNATANGGSPLAQAFANTYVTNGTSTIGGGSGGVYYQYDMGLGNSVLMQAYLVYCIYPFYPKTWTLQGSNDGVNFVNLDTETVTTLTTGQTSINMFIVPGLTVAYRFYRLGLVTYSDGNIAGIGALIVYGTRFVTKSASFKPQPFVITATAPTPTPFHGALYQAPSFTIHTSAPTPIAGKIVKFNASAFTITTTFNHPTQNFDYKFHATPFTINAQTPSINIGGSNITYPAGAIEDASAICVHGTKLYIATNTSPAYLSVVDISTPASPVSTRYTLTGASNAEAIAYDASTGMIYVACANGKIVEVTAATPGTFTVYSSGASGNLTSVALLPVLDESYFGTDFSTGEVLAFIEAPFSTFGMNINFSEVVLDTIGTNVNFINSQFFGTDIRFVATLTPSIGCDVRFLAEDIADLAHTPIARTDFHVYVNGTELTDVKLDSIEITHTADEKSMARFVVARKHDQVDYKLDGTHQQLTGQQPVTITIAGNEEFGYDTPAYIWDIDTKSETESVVITAYSELPKQDVRSTVTLSIPSINEKLHIYHALVDNPVIENPFIMPDDPNPPFYQGIVIDTGYQEVQYGTQLTNNFAFGQQTAEQRANWILGSGDSGIYDFDGDSQYFTPLPNYTYFWFVTATNFLTGETLQGTPGTAGSGDGADFSSSLAYIGTSLSPVTSDAWIITDINFWAQRVYPYTKLRGPMPGESIIYTSDLFGVTLFNDSVLRDHSPMTYSGSEIDSMRFALITASNPQNVGFTSGAYNSLNASTKLLDVIDSRFGVHFGSAPYKKVSAKNGWKAPTITWEDQADGLYVHEDAGFNYLGYINQVGALELKKIQNINGTILPKTKCDVELFMDGYYHYSIALLMRINIDNTTTAGIYNNNNGFPCSVKTIHISAKDMKVTLGCTNAWSRYELLEMEGQMPDPNRYVTFELRQKICNKLNPATNTTTS